MIKFLRANFYIGLVYVLFPIIAICYLAILLGLVLMGIVAKADMSNIIRHWGLIMYIDLKWFILVLQHGLTNTIKAHREIRKEL